MEKTQVVVVLDADDTVPDGELLPNLPPATHLREVVRLRQFLPPPVVREGPTKGPVDWLGLAHCVSRMAEAIRQDKQRRSHPTEFVVAGRAPLPAFLQLGFSLSAWAGSTTLANRRKDQRWDIFSVDGPCAGGSTKFFDVATFPPAPSEATGLVAVYVSCLFRADHELLHEFVRQQGNHLAGIVEIATGVARELDASTAANAAGELTEHFGRIADAFPRRTGIALFVAGPATLAYLVGRAINSKVHANVQVAGFEPTRGYEYCFTLPLIGRVNRELPEDSEAVQGRERCLSLVVDAVTAVQTDLGEEDLPSTLSAGDGSALLERLRAVVIEPTPAREFRLSVLRGRLSVGAWLLEALRREPDESIRRVSQLLVLHELYHVMQGLESTNFHDIGRTGVALEEIDFYADAVSVEALLRMWARTNKPAAPSGLAAEAEALVRSVLIGMRAFDRIEYGTVITRPPERRLRRYLIWSLQLVRASLVQSLGDAQELFGARLIAELGPLRGALDERYEKIVLDVLPSTQFAVALNQRVRRMPRSSNFDPAEILRAICEFDDETLLDAMEVIVNEWRDLLAGWRTRS